jgi:aspartate/methionine/tyrosine aminotransferase
MNAITGLTSRGLETSPSMLRALANRTMDIDGLIPLWFGEPDVPTPDFIIDAAHQAMRDGKTTYSEGLGKPQLRHVLSTYMTGLYQKPVSADRIAVTVSGTNAINLAFQLLLNAGDRVVTTSPSFPTLLSVPALQNAQVDTVPLVPSADGWRIDLDHLIEAAQSAKILLINSPNNPTGWMTSDDEIKTVLEACRESGTWIISDEVYARIVYDRKVAPSFADHSEPEDRVLIVNSFSKSWAMTGWRLGWLTMPPSLLLECEKLMEFSMSCAPEFVQAGGIAAITSGEAFIESQIGRYKAGLDLSVSRLSAIEGVSCITPSAAFYAVFQKDGVADSAAFAEELARHAKVGIAPGQAFDTSMKDWFRICFAKDVGLLSEAFDRIEEFLND